MKTQKKPKHVCPPWCHRCPLCVGPHGEAFVMPGCMGTAASGRNDLSQCTCARTLKSLMKKRKFVRELVRRIDYLEKRVEALEKGG